MGALACWASNWPMWRSSSRGRSDTSTTNRMTSASGMLVTAASTMNSPSRVWGWWMPGVSTKTVWLIASVRTPRMRRRVVCGLGETMATFWPT